jgi:hypothetical protein
MTPEIKPDIAYFCPPEPPYGKHRRQLIVEWFNNNPSGRLYVNCKYRPQLKDDTDLKYLIKKGFLVMQREQTYRSNHGWFGMRVKNSSCRKTYLIKSIVPNVENK